ncbi:hypothetical protein HAX54_016847 [Datura stramonium]|uniref:Protein kinase domain-containing protein n=1 Tax=Datura stramonium TaxID=4076 RepID=A0ABS8UM02_DATST|nr:hypothetical protein [Datura stramonium]
MLQLSLGVKGDVRVAVYAIYADCTNYINNGLGLYGNPVCGYANERQIIQFCKSKDGVEEYGRLNNSIPSCLAQQPCNNYFEHIPTLTNGCFCAAPFGVGLRLRSPSISDFPPHYTDFERWISDSVNLNLYQIYIHSIAWENGPRLRMFLKIFPPRINDFDKFNDSEIHRIANIFFTFNLAGSDIFGSYDLLNFTAMGYNSVLFPQLEGGGSRINRGTVVGIVLGSICAAAVLIMAIIFVLLKMRQRFHVSKDQPLPKFPMRIEGVKAFSFKELEAATNSFSSTTEIGQGGYGKVYKGILPEGTIVAIKRAQQGSLQGKKEFYTEIELLSRLHHRNLVSLLGYCNEGIEQMLVYEFMPNGSLRDLLSARYGERLSLGTRLYIALGVARGILYLHTEADPPIIHRDIKANNILLDSKFTAKVSDFGISRLAPLPDAETSGHVSTVVKGTPGYLDPEYLFTHKLTEKSDVYSLGIVFLELLTGMQPISHGRNIVRENEKGNVQFNVNKSSGSDGFGADFFRDAWSIVGADITTVVLEFLRSGQMLKRLNSIMITLIPKDKAKHLIMSCFYYKFLCQGPRDKVYNAKTQTSDDQKRGSGPLMAPCRGAKIAGWKARYEAVYAD